MVCLSQPLDFGVLVKHPGESLPITLDFEPNLARYREPGRLYRAGDVVRPRMATGRAYRAQADGTSGHGGPVWKTTEGSVTKDGSVQWEAIPAGYEGIDVITNASGLFDDPSVVISSLHWEGATVLFSLSGGDDGQDYQGTVTVVTAAGQTLIGVFTVKVRADRVVCV